MTAKLTIGLLLILAAISCENSAAPIPEPVLHEPGRIVFIRRTAWDTWAGEIYTVDPNGGTAVATGITGQICCLTLSPDAAHIVFVRNVNTIPSQLVVVDSNGSNLRVLDSAKTVWQPSWNPVNDLIAYSTGELGGPRLFTIRPDGSGKKHIYEAVVTADEPSWSPYGTELTFRWNLAKIGVIDANGGNARLVVDQPQPSNPAGSPAWSPDGKKIVYVQEDNPSGTTQIRIITASGSPLQTLTSGSLDGSPAWSPDGQRIVFLRTTYSADFKKVVSQRLYTISANGGALTPLTPDGAGFDDSPAWGRK